MLDHSLLGGIADGRGAEISSIAGIHPETSGSVAASGYDLIAAPPSPRPLPQDQWARDLLQAGTLNRGDPLGIWLIEKRSADFGRRHSQETV